MDVWMDGTDTHYIPGEMREPNKSGLIKNEQWHGRICGWSFRCVCVRVCLDFVLGHDLFQFFNLSLNRRTSQTQTESRTDQNDKYTIVHTQHTTHLCGIEMINDSHSLAQVEFCIHIIYTYIIEQYTSETKKAFIVIACTQKRKQVNRCLYITTIPTAHGERIIAERMDRGETVAERRLAKKHTSHGVVTNYNATHL